MSARQRSESLLYTPSLKTIFPFRVSSGVQATPSVEDKAFSLFQPDILLPAQYFETTRRKSHLEPEKKLMLAVLEDAIWCFQNCLLARDKKRKSLFGEAEEWLMEETSDWLFSFENICEVLGLNPMYMRKGLLSWKDKELAEQPKARIYRLGRRGVRKKPTVHEPRARGQKFLKAAGF